MQCYYLCFDESIIDAENRMDWDFATTHVYNTWKADPNNIEKLVCAGTELWFAMLICDEYLAFPSASIVAKLPEYDLLEAKLHEVTCWGCTNFSSHPAFNIFFGYMFQCMPYFFTAYKGDYDGWRQRGIDMIRRGYMQETDNPFYSAMFFLKEENVALFQEARDQLIKQIDTKKWKSEVQTYFLRILDCI